MKPNQVRNLLKPLYYRVDNEIATYPKICTRGCFHCCYQPIELIVFEKVTLGDFIKNQLDHETKQSIKANTLKWLDFFDSNTSDVEPLTADDAYVQFREKSENIPYPCPLLINNECSVYKARPLTCRTHIVNDSVELCMNDKLRDGDKRAMVFRTEKVHELKSQFRQVEIIPLPYAIVDILEIKRDLKRIERSAL
ncbi:MAG: YkgJ family cysteine cluster protein [Bacteroidetes bacterium]|nr:YkgJ family cysteine cluster protein [Bacteroidota bacterium]